MATAPPRRRKDYNKELRELVLTLHETDGLTVTEIGELIGVSHQRVSVYLKEAREDAGQERSQGDD